MFYEASRQRREFEWTFFCALGRPGRLDDAVREFGGKIIYSPHPIAQKRPFFRYLRSVMKEGDYDILHSHHDFISAIYLCAAHGISFRKRIVHVHNTDESILTPSLVKQSLLKEPMRRICLRLADNIVGISENTLHTFLRNRELKPGRDSVLYYGIDTSAFHQSALDPKQFRSSLGFSADAKILLFTGRMVTLKNPCYLIEVLAAVSRKDPNVVAVFAGAGELESIVIEMAKAKGLEDKVRVLGWRDDTAALMQACDIFVFPRLEEPKEGLGLVIVEAQAAGLPVLASYSLAEDVFIIPELFEMIPLSSGPQMWADVLLQMLSKKYPPRDECLKRIENSVFSLGRGVENLMSLYSASA